MKKIFGIVLSMLLCIVLLSGIACSNKANPEGSKVLPRLEINKSSVELLIGDVAIISAYSTVDDTITYLSLNPEIATVDSNGKILAVSIGETYIYINAGKEEKTCKVTVKKINYSIQLDVEDEFNIQVGTWRTISATVLEDGRVSNAKITWSLASSIGEIIYLDNNRIDLFAKDVGVATLSAAIGNTSVSCAINIVNV